ncbi:MAG: 2,3-bisphosphoglycerate-independent phosphoglycerate mutase [Alphaproteobacteria bacterium]|nr:2,3-bisphosphoglycerate-independent phosphoglycerate mutase [Alphaproteobacteria bacterium]
MSSPSRPRPVVLCVLDGWGEAAPAPDNAIALARTPNFRSMRAAFPHALLETSGAAVGLPDGQMGNSEVGHMNIGTGRVVMQDLPRIDQAVADGSLARHRLLLDLIATLKRSGGVCHLLGLISPGGVHSHQAHIAALARAVAGAGVPVIVHGFLDGRDTPPRSALDYVTALERDMAGAGTISIGTIGGRYYAMDRDKRWERVARAYGALVEAKAPIVASVRQAIEASYRADVGDEFVEPRVITGYAGMTDGDGLLMANFRADRVRQILHALLDPSFDGFARGRVTRFAAVLGMSSYSEALSRRMGALFPSATLDHTLGALVAAHGLKQLRIAETEKYAHVTFFFNGGEERVFPGEERIMVPSPKVATYDLVPAMSAPEVTDRLVEAIGAARFDFIVVNYANTDMVGHTGDLTAAISAVEAVDQCLGRLRRAVEAAGGVLMITADHGNAEQLRDRETHEPHTAHTANLVPVLLVGAPVSSLTLRHGRLADVAPTLLNLMGIEAPDAMTGRSLIEREIAGAGWRFSESIGV